MKKIFYKIVLLLLCLYSLFFILGCIFAPIMAHFKNYELSATITSIFCSSCHQKPDRTFWLLGYPMALCCRCFGFYIGVFIFTIYSMIRRLDFSKKYILVISFICLIDIILNYYFRNTGNYIRFIVGFLMGILFVVVINYLFRFKKEKKNEN